MVGKASIYLKAVNSLDDSDVRISKRAQIPYNRLRGFQRGKVGPTDNNDFIGGNYVTTLNLATIYRSIKYSRKCRFYLFYRCSKCLGR